MFVLSGEWFDFCVSSSDEKRGEEELDSSLCEGIGVLEGVRPVFALGGASLMVLSSFV